MGLGLALKKVTMKGCLERGARRPSRPARPGSTLCPEREDRGQSLEGSGSARGHGRHLCQGRGAQEHHGGPEGSPVPRFPHLQTRVPVQPPPREGRSEGECGRRAWWPTGAVLVSRVHGHSRSIQVCYFTLMVSLVSAVVLDLLCH